MKLSLFIAGRYLFSRKSHNVINVVSAVSAVGMAVGTAAIIVILSVYNGFGSLISQMMGNVEPDLAVVPSEGKFFVPEGEAFDWAYDCPDILNMCTVLSDNVLACYDGRQTTVACKGVDEVYDRETPLRSCVRTGEWMLGRGDVDYAAVGAALAAKLNLNVRFSSPLELYYPRRGARISAANPMAAVSSVRVWPSCTVAVSADTDETLVVVPRKAMLALVGCAEDEVSSVEIRLKDGLSPFRIAEVRRELQARLDKAASASASPALKVQDRLEQNPDMYRMLNYEKAGVYLIMFFVVLILGFSIFGSLKMLIIDKSGDIATLRAMGADRELIRRIFTLEGWLITLTGLGTGMAAGMAFSLAQQRFGIVKMPGAFIVEAYPAVLDWGDVALCSILIAVIGYVIALIPSRGCCSSL